MIKSNGTLEDAKDEINKLKEQPLNVTVNLGRNKFLEFKGELAGVYPALFTIKPLITGFRGKTTYSYAEYMCGRVKLKKEES